MLVVFIQIVLRLKMYVALLKPETYHTSWHDDTGQLHIFPSLVFISFFYLFSGKEGQKNAI